MIEVVRPGGVEYCCVERAIESGTYIKHNTNSGFVQGDEHRATPHCARASRTRSGDKLIVVDIQGVDDIFTDPQIRAAATLATATSASAGWRSSSTSRYDALCKALRLQRFALSLAELKRIEAKHGGRRRRRRRQPGHGGQAAAGAALTGVSSHNNMQTLTACDEAFRKRKSSVAAGRMSTIARRTRWRWRRSAPPLREIAPTARRRRRRRCAETRPPPSTRDCASTACRASCRCARTSRPPASTRLRRRRRRSRAARRTRRARAVGRRPAAGISLAAGGRRRSRAAAGLTASPPPATSRRWSRWRTPRRPRRLAAAWVRLALEQEGDGDAAGLGGTARCSCSSASPVLADSATPPPRPSSSRRRRGGDGGEEDEARDEASTAPRAPEDD